MSVRVFPTLTLLGLLMLPLAQRTMAASVTKEATPSPTVTATQPVTSSASVATTQPVAAQPVATAPAQESRLLEWVVCRAEGGPGTGHACLADDSRYGD
jgi:hypothetical protein